jgi:hypothetical protein
MRTVACCRNALGFDAFYVTHENNLAKHGLGIGLWLARRLVEMHEGTIVAKSEAPRRGAEFCVEIPLTIAVAAGGGHIAQSLAATAGLGRELACSPINPAAESLDS